ncbi:BsuBI/PstI family type II restriction endonuclease [Gardnerella sp. Marseille-QA0894]|uniref:BsuBI/PstI family type II restriction endonuclease n=1 Tax=Gardnerella sp. Marseille-QA0894 TaxID=3383031 RepID=UPI003AF9754E
MDEDLLDYLDIHLVPHVKAPDVIVWYPHREWLFLIEAASTHGSVDITRKDELHAIFNHLWYRVVLIFAFPSRKIMQHYLADLAWETEHGVQIHQTI